MEKGVIMLRLLFLTSVLFFHAVLLQAEGFDHGVWDKLLKTNVHPIEGGKATQLDYDGMLKKRAELQQYLKSLSQVTRDRFDGWEKDVQLAFLINVYNSWTVELILTKYPEIESIKELGSLFTSPWKKEIVQLFGGEYSLDDVEHTFIRASGRYNDPRIHFAVNCASIGCPALRAEAYTGDLLQAQLEDATVMFLKDRSRNRFSDKGLEVSSIFKWYRGDFEKGWRGFSSLEEFFLQYAEALELSEGYVTSLPGGEIGIHFLRYDWQLNSIHTL